ncbi:MAG: cytidylate kinase-like family protein [Lachnospiraceae bacterium]|nr:cytidylate kinase-like family protein [Lachnospiraceae bacterium]
MKKVITISRQYASGGRTIGKMVADKLGIPLYDTEIIKDTMKKTGLPAEMVEAAEQRVTNSFLFNLAMGVDDAHNHMKQIEKAEHEIIQGYVKKEPCVIVGRSANFVLEEKDSINVFVFSDIKDRISYAASHYDVEEKQAKLMIEKTDRERKMHAMSFYSKEWGNKNNYDLLMNSGKLGIEKCVELIVNAAK